MMKYFDMRGGLLSTIAVIVGSAAIGTCIGLAIVFPGVPALSIISLIFISMLW